MEVRVVGDLNGVLSGRQLTAFELVSVRIEEVDRVVVVDVSRQDGKRRRAGSLHGDGHCAGERADECGKRKADDVSPQQLLSSLPLSVVH